MIRPLNDTAQHVLSILENTSFSEGLRTYSGRGMSGRVCLGVEITRHQVFELGYEMARALYRDLDPSGTITPAPLLDDMGGGVIAYWPAARVAEEETEDE